MKHKENTRIYESDEGKMFVRISDNFIMGYGLCLGENDSIENYEEREFTEEQIAEFWKSIGIDDVRKTKENKTFKNKSHSRQPALMINTKVIDEISRKKIPFKSSTGKKQIRKIMQKIRKQGVGKW